MMLASRNQVFLKTTDNNGGSKKTNAYIQRIYDDSAEELFDRKQEMSKRMDIMEGRHYHRYF